MGIHSGDLFVSARSIRALYTTEGLTLDLDDDEIIGCHLVDCRILFCKRQPIFSDSHSKGCDFEFSKSALVTIQTGGLQHARRSDGELEAAFRWVPGIMPTVATRTRLKVCLCLQRKSGREMPGRMMAA
jgi:hypothetical protein